MIRHRRRRTISRLIVLPALVAVAMIVGTFMAVRLLQPAPPRFQPTPDSETADRGPSPDAGRATLPGAVGETAAPPVRVPPETTPGETQGTTAPTRAAAPTSTPGSPPRTKRNTTRATRRRGDARPPGDGDLQVRWSHDKP